MDAGRPDVSVLLVTWNSSGVLEPMLSSLARAASGIEHELVHVDNASSDGSPGLVVRHWSARLAQSVNRRNVGFAAALRQAVGMADGEFLLLLNPDARVHESALRTLVDRLRRDPELGAVGPLIQTPGGAVEFVCARRAPGLREALIEAIGLRPVLRGTRLDPYTYPLDSYESERDVPCLSGAAMLIRASSLDSCGGVDDRFFMYFEDID